MPIDIIPKPPEQESILLNILFYVSIGLFIAAVLSYFLLIYLQSNIRETLEEAEISLQITQTPEEQEVERSVLQYQKKIDDFAFILGQHQTNSNFFPFLEGITHPEVKFSHLSLTKPSVELSGEAENFVVLDQQLSILQKTPQISNINLSQISLGREGGTTFTIRFILSPEIFKFE